MLFMAVVVVVNVVVLFLSSPPRATIDTWDLPLLSSDLFVPFFLPSLQRRYISPVILVKLGPARLKAFKVVFSA
jgi:hypothetical protein